jgi:Ca2+-binding RTX toxin-like protein
MPTGTSGDDLFTASTGNESFDGGAGVDTVSYANSGTGVYANLETGQSTPLLKIMPFGDSITYGIISNGTVKDLESGGYRVHLWNSLQTQDLAIDYVGSISSGPLSFPDRDNEGLRGKTISYLNTVDQQYLNTYKPDVVLLMIGTNDTESRTADQMISDLRSLLISIATNTPGATIFVAGIPPIYDAAENAVAQQYNALIPGLVAELEDTYNIIFVDTSDLTLADITPPPADEGVHLTAAGYEKLAGIWLDAITDSGLFEDERDTLASIENVTGSNYGDKLVGDGASNVLSGLAGNDQLIGGAGNDTLDGGVGGDTLTGGSGDDTYVVDSSSDVVVENAGEGNDTIRTTKASYSLVNLPNVENLTYTGSAGATLTGNAADNSINGGGGNDTIDGRGGADTMAGGSGADTYVVNDAGDSVAEAANSGTDTVKASVSFTLAENVEKLTLTGTGAIDGTGNSLANTITGNAAANDLSGSYGNDTLIGGAGGDHLFGGYGADILRGGGGTDFLTGDSGADKFDWDNVGDAGVDAARDQVFDFVHGTDKLDLSTIDAKAGTASNDAFTFRGANAFSGVAGQLRAELVHGPDGDYTLVQGDVNGDGVADFEIALVGYTATLQASDFLL